MDIEPRLLRHFLKVAEELHFGRAAATLYLSQPALSESIKRLEFTLGVELLVRTNRRVELTPAGRVLQVQAPEILRQIERATASVVATARDEAHRFRVGYSPFLDLNRISEVRSRFQAEQSGWIIEFTSAKTTDLTNGLRNGEISAALLIGPVTGERITSEVVSEEPFIVGLPADHPLTIKDSIRFTDLANEKVIRLPRSFHPAFYDGFVAACEALGYKPNFAFEVTTRSECLHLIDEHRGITFTTKSAQSLAHPGVLFRPLDKEVLFRSPYGGTCFVNIKFVSNGDLLLQPSRISGATDKEVYEPSSHPEALSPHISIVGRTGSGKISASAASILPIMRSTFLRNGVT